MSEYFSTERLAVVTNIATGATWVDVASMTVAAADQVAGARYVGLWSAEGSVNTTASSVRLRLVKDGVAVQQCEFQGKGLTSPPDNNSAGGVFIFQAAETPADASFAIQVQRGINAATATGKAARITLLRLGPDDHFIQNLAAQTTTSDTLQTAASLSFTPASPGDYLVLGFGVSRLDHASNVNLRTELSDGATSTGEVQWRPAGTTDRAPVVKALDLPAVSGARTVTLKYREGGVGTTTVGLEYCTIVALRLDRFPNVYRAAMGADSAGTQTAYQTALSQTFTPTAGAHLTLAFWGLGANSGTITAFGQYDDGGTVVTEFYREVAFAAADAVPAFSQRLAAYPATARTQSIQRKSETTGLTTTLRKPAMIVTLEMPGAAAAGAAEITEASLYALTRPGTSAEVAEASLYVLCCTRPCLTRECQIWTIRRKDGTVYRFTSLDRDLVHGGQTYKACDSMVPSASSSANEVGSVGDINLSGIVGEGAGSVTLADLHAGRLDGAFVEAWRVSWDGTTEPKAIMRGTFGSVSFGERGFSVDLTGDGARLQQTPLLRTVAPGCDLVFGSTPCGKALGPLTVTGTAATGQGQRGFTDPTRTEPDGYFNYGRVTFTSGANAGISAEIKSHAAGVFALWPRLAEPVSAGDAYSMTPGCSNLMESAGGTNGCLAWGRRESYGGFDQVPGQDALSATPKAKA